MSSRCPTPGLFGTDRLLPALLALGVGAVWLAVPVETLHLSDGHWLIQQVRDREFLVDRHRLTALALFGWAEITGLDAPRAITSLAAVAMALTTWSVVGLARRVGATSGASLLAGALFAATPAVTFCATSVELHAPFLPLAAMTLMAAQAWIRRASRPRPPVERCAGAAGLSAVAAVATAAHNSGLVLLPLAACWLGLGPMRDARRPLWQGLASLGLVMALQIALWRLTVHLLDATPWILDDGNVPYVGTGPIARLGGGFLDLPHSLLHEWLIPFAPASALVWWAARAPALRPQTLGLALALLGYAFSCGFVGLAHSEFGAYLLPLAIPASILLARTSPRWLALGALAGAIAFTVTHQFLADPDRGRHAPFTDAVRALAEDRPARLLVLLNPRIDHVDCDLDEMAACLVHQPPLDHFDLSALAQIPAPTLHAQSAWLLALLPPDGRTFVSLRTLEILEQHPERHPSGAALVSLIRGMFRLDPVRNGPFVGFELVAR